MVKEKEQMVVRSIRIPVGVRDGAIEKAQESGIMSLNALIVWLLRKYVEK